MKRKTVITITTFLLLISTVICIITGMIKWPGLISSLGLTYRQIPMAVITNIHDWSGLIMTALCAVHVFQFRGMMMRMIRSNSNRSHYEKN